MSLLKKKTEQTTLDSFFNKEIEKKEFPFYRSYRDYIPLGTKWSDIEDD